jgi:hypothetical protein
METLWELEWRAEPAGLIAAAGAWLALRGAVGQVRGFRTPLERPGKNLWTMRAMRGFLQGISLMAIGLGWWLQWPAMVAAGLVFGFEETLETSIVVWALRKEYDADRLGASAAPVRDPRLNPREAQHL